MRILLAGVLFEDPSCDPVEFFEAEPPEELKERWLGSRLQPITQAELYAVLAAKAVWRDKLKYRRVKWFIDNMGA
eukprot:4125797-Amphidinium_carterae.1